LAALPKLQAQLGGIKSDTEEILAILQQLMARADLSPQVKPRDELTQYNSANLELIGQAQQLLKRILSSEPQYLLTGESPQTLLPRRLAEAPELFELLCDCVWRLIQENELMWRV